jgi:hypothetical protein
VASASIQSFHGLFNIAGIAGQLAHGERELGFGSKSICFQSGVGQSAADETIKGGLIQVDLLKRCLGEFDVFNFHFGYSFLGQSLRDLSLLKQSGKRIAMHFHGCDIRDSKRTIKTDTFSACAACWPVACNANRQFARDEAARSANIITVSTPDLLRFVPGSVWLPQAVDTAAILDMANKHGTLADAGRKTVRIAHAPSSTKLKGTDLLISAVEALKKEGFDLELDLLHNLPHALVIERMSRADIVVDQLLIGAYGVTAVEAMLLGKPTICYIREDAAEHYGTDCPLLNSRPDQIKQCLVDVIDRRDDWFEIGAKGREYALRTHDRKAVAARLRACYGDAA